MAFESFFYTWGNGIMEAFIFLLIFTILFAVLQKTRIFGEAKKQFNVIVALAVTFIVMIPHWTNTYPANFDVIEIIKVMLPQISLIAVLLIMLLILVGVFAPGYAGWVAGVGAVLVLVLFLGTTNWLYGLDWLTEFFGEEIVHIAIIILVFGIVIWFITSEPRSEKAASGIRNMFEKLFGK